MNFPLRVFLIMAFAGLFGLTTYELIGFIGQWYEIHFVKNDSDLSKAYIVFLVALTFSIIAGAWVGNRIYSRHFKK